jgi:two-component system, LuxR family, response regulator FixJ
MSRALHIAVVDDEETVRRSMQRLLVSYGYRVRTFASVDEFLTAVDRDSTACVIADLRMPGKTGLDLLDALRAAQIALPVIIISGHGELDAAERARRAGALAFLWKPVDEGDLLVAIAAVIQAEGT